MNEPGGAQDIAYTGSLPFINDAATVNNVSPAPGATANNYAYDALGNLVRDTREGITSIDWTAAGKVRRVVRTDGTVLYFAYGAGGQRIMKEVIPAQGDAHREHYVRDAQGNIMAIYRATPGSLALTERPLYGSARLGALRKSEELCAAPSSSGPDPVQQLELRYELTDHLGNVCAVLTGRLLPGNGMGSAWQPEVVGAQGYEAFGSLLPGRNYSSSSYRYGMNEQEKDDEVYGSTGTSYTAEFWQYDTRTARRWNLDPKPNPSISFYAAFALNPIMFSDPLGDTVKYDRFRDRVNSFFGRVFSKSYRDQFDTWKNSDEIYTIGKRAGSPSLISGGLEYTCPEDMCNHEITYDRTGAIGNVVPDVDLSITANGAAIGQRTRVRDITMDFTGPVNQPDQVTSTIRLRRVVPNTPMLLDANNYPDIFNVTDGAGATLFNNSIVDPNEGYQNVFFVGNNMPLNSGAGGRMSVMVTSNRPWPRAANFAPPRPQISNWQVTYRQYLIRLPRIRLTVQ